MNGINCMLYREWEKTSSMQLVVSNMVHAHPHNNDAKLCVWLQRWLWLDFDDDDDDDDGRYTSNRILVSWQTRNAKKSHGLQEENRIALKIGAPQKHWFFHYPMNWRLNMIECFFVGFPHFCRNPLLIYLYLLWIMPYRATFWSIRANQSARDWTPPESCRRHPNPWDFQVERGGEGLNLWYNWWLSRVSSMKTG